MDFVIEQRLVGPPARVQDALLDPEFVAASAQLPKLGDAELLERQRDATTARLRVRLRFTGSLAPAVTAVVDPARLTWVDVASFDLVGLRAEHRIEPDHYADRLSCGYSSELAASGTGTHRTLRGSVKVRMLLVGGKVEGAIVSGLREHAAAEAVLLDAWLRPGTPRSGGDAASS
ncbi:MAG: DUF2505 family protein [Acidimicrobiia bacterium]